MTVEFEALVDTWTLSMYRRGLEPSSIEKRIRMLTNWWAFVDGRVFDADFRDVDRFISSKKLGAASSRYGVTSHLHMFYLWAMRSGHTANDPTAMVERPRMKTRLPRPIHDTDLSIAVALSTGEIRAAILLAATSGLRCIELARLKWGDIDDGQIRVLGKGSKERVVPLHDEARVALEALTRRDEWVFSWREAPGQSPGRRASRTINGYLHSIGVAATAHTLRHWCATKAYNATRDLRGVQELLGHSSPATTAIYAALDVGRLRSIVDLIEVPVA